MTVEEANEMILEHIKSTNSKMLKKIIKEQRHSHTRSIVDMIRKSKSREANSKSVSPMNRGVEGVVVGRARATS
jgi:hypothetical protein